MRLKKLCLLGQRFFIFEMFIKIASLLVLKLRIKIRNDEVELETKEEKIDEAPKKEKDVCFDSKV